MALFKISFLNANADFIRKYQILGLSLLVGVLSMLNSALISRIGILLVLGLSLFGYQNCSKGLQLSLNEQNSKLGEQGVGSPDPFLKSCGEFKPGQTLIHRLTNKEYNNTVRDLVFTNQNPADQFPPTVAGYSGYTNDSKGLAVSDTAVEKYFLAAQSLANEVVASKPVTGGAYSKISGCGLSVTASNLNACIQKTVRSFAARAFRRPVTDEEVTQLSKFFANAADFDSGLKALITASLISPKFLFVSSVSPNSQLDGFAFYINEYELASRLSYFLWQSMPDDTLMKIAENGQLHDPLVLSQQVQRMLKDNRSIAFTRMLRDEWLGLGKLNNPIANLDDSLRQAMIQETDLLLNDIVKSDQPFVNFYTANYTYVNKILANYYGLPFTAADPTQFVRTAYVNDQRLGVLSHASFLSAQGGMAAETSTVKRGHALSSYVFCIPFGPPPPGVLPNLNADPSLVGNPRQKLLQATGSNNRCSGCHSTMNNLGFGLNIYSSFGQYRTNYTTHADAVDSSGAVPGQLSFSTGIEMLRMIPKLDSVKKCFPQQVMAIATTRDVRTNDDQCVQNMIGQATSSPSSKFSDMVLQTVLSRQFQMQMGEAQ